MFTSLPSVEGASEKNVTFYPLKKRTLEGTAFFPTREFMCVTDVWDVVLGHV